MICPQDQKQSDPLDWQAAIHEAGCFDYLMPKATRAADEVLRRQPALDGLLGGDGRGQLAELCMSRLRLLYERPLLHAVLERMHQDGKLPASMQDLDPVALRSAAEAVREGLLADGGAQIEAEAPLVREYESAIIRNYVNAISEMFDRLLREHTGVSVQLLGGEPFTCIQGISVVGDMHCHGRSALRIQTETGAFYYKPRPWGIDALLEELVDCWFPGCAVVPRFVRGDGYSFVAELAAPALSSEDELSAYWYHLGALAALFHGLGSRDMTEDNVLCAGVRPAVVDAETLLAGSLVRQKTDRVEPRPSVLNTSLLPWPDRGELRSPLTTDNATANCLPRMGAIARTVAGFEGAFMDGFTVGYRRLLKARGNIEELLKQAKDVPYRKVLLNTHAYTQARARLFSAKGLRAPSQREHVARWLWDRYGSAPAALRRTLAEADMAALVEGDIPCYSASIGGFALEEADSESAIDNALAKSASDIARERLALLDEDELAYELEIIESALVNR